MDDPIKYDIESDCEEHSFCNCENNEQITPYLRDDCSCFDEAAEAVANKNGGVIWMMGGTYEISTTVQLASKHSGSRQAPLFIKAYEDADVTLTANTTISTDSSLWHYVDAAENLGVYERLPEEARDEIL